MADNEKLIEGLRTILARAPIHMTAEGVQIIADAIDALEAAEKAHTPTDDEREALAGLIANIPTAPLMRVGGDAAHAIADVVLAAGFRRSEAPEPSARVCGPCSRGQHAPCDRANEFWGDCTCSCNAPEPQGEPSDAQVLAALNAYWGVSVAESMPHYSPEGIDHMRAALRAAAGVDDQEGQVER